MRTLLVLVIALLLSSITLGEESFDGLVEAVQAKDDVRALQIVEKLEENGQSSFGLYYNQGLAYRDQARFAQARAAFEKALLYSPRDLATRRRLREVKEKLSPQLAEKDVTGTPLWTPVEAKIALAIVSLLALTLGFGRALGKPISAKAVTVGFLFVLALIALLYLTDPPPSRGVVIAPKARLLPEARSGEGGAVINKGILVEVMDRKGHYLQVRLKGDETGWLREGELIVL